MCPLYPTQRHTLGLQDEKHKHYDLTYSINVKTRIHQPHILHKVTKMPPMDLTQNLE